MLKKLFLTIMCIGAFALMPTYSHAIVIEVTDEPAEEFDPNANTDSNTSEKDDVVIEENVTPNIVTDNSEKQKETFEELNDIKYVSEMAKNNSEIGINIDTQCYLKLQKEGKSHDDIMLECSSYDVSKIGDVLTDTASRNKGWFQKTCDELLSSEELFSYLGEFFKNFFN